MAKSGGRKQAAGGRKSRRPKRKSAMAKFFTRAQLDQPLPRRRRGEWPNGGLLTARQRADLRTGVVKSVVIAAGTMAGLNVIEKAVVKQALDILREENRELKRQVRVLKAELKVQAAMWKHAREGRFEKRAGDPEKHVFVRPSVTETAEKHAQLALLRAKPGNKGNRELCKQVGLSHFPRKSS